MACQLDSTGSSLRHRVVTTLQVTAMLSVRDSELATQKFYLDLKVQLLFTTDNISPVLANTETDRSCGVINLETTLTGNPPENTHRKNRATMRLCSLFGNSMEYSPLCDVLIDQVMLNYVVWFIVTDRMLAAVHSHNLVIITLLDVGLCAFKH